MPASTPGPLSNLRVIDLSREITGPYASKLFADAGADVVKVESSAGDPLRHWSASNSEIPAGESGALFKYLNSSKRGVVADARSTSAEDSEALAGRGLVPNEAAVESFTGHVRAARAAAAGAVRAHAALAVEAAGPAVLAAQRGRPRGGALGHVPVGAAAERVPVEVGDGRVVAPVERAVVAPGPA